MSIFSRLPAIANTSKYGSALDPNGDLSTQLNKTPALMTKWQYDAVANSEVSDYYINPVSSSANTLGVLLSNLASQISTTTFDYASTVATSISAVLANTNNTVNTFIAHTNRLSGITSTTDPTLPDFDTAVGIGEIVLMITNKYDGVENNLPILGSMGSLFIKNEIQTTIDELTIKVEEFEKTIRLVHSGDPEIGDYNASNITILNADSLLVTVQTANNLLANTVTSDVLFYNSSKSIVEDYSKISRFTNFSPLKLYMINNFIGAEKLKSKL